MKMPTIFAAAKVACVALVAVVLAMHPKQVIHGLVAQTPTEVTSQVVQQGQALNDLTRRVTALEAANLQVQLATVQSQLAIDHQFLMAILLMMITLAAESVWRLAGGRKHRVE